MIACTLVAKLNLSDPAVLDAPIIRIELPAVGKPVLIWQEVLVTLDTKLKPTSPLIYDNNLSFMASVLAVSHVGLTKLIVYEFSVASDELA